MENNENIEVTQETESNKKDEPQTNGSTPSTTPTKTSIFKKWWFWVIIGVLVIAIIAGGSSSDNSGNQGSGDVTPSGSSSALGDYEVVIASCRLAEDYKGKPVVIVKYEFTNNGDDPAAFWVSLDAEVYQNGIGLNECIFVDDSANYSSDNQTKEIKKGAKLSVEVAYVLNDTTTPIDVEVSELISFSDKKVTKTFTIN